MSVFLVRVDRILKGRLARPNIFGQTPHEAYRPDRTVLARSGKLRPAARANSSFMLPQAFLFPRFFARI